MKSHSQKLEDIRQFIARWTGHGYEKGEIQQFGMSPRSNGEGDIGRGAKKNAHAQIGNDGGIEV